MNTPGQIDASVQTNQGRVRDHNEDFVTCWEPTNSEEEAKNGWLYIVADGVGGADAGEIASQFASERTLEHFLANSQESDWGQRLLQAMQVANTDLRQLVADRDDNSRMATTMVAAIIRDQQAIITNVGDSRGYHWRDGNLRQITKDQSLVAKLVEEGAITEAEALNHPRKNVILSSLGSEKHPKIDLFEFPLQSGDILFLCSDGLTRHVSDQEIEEIISQQEPSLATDSLIELANQRGGEDNISAAVIHYRHKQTAVQNVTGQTRTSSEPTHSQTLLWLYTIFLSLVQTILIFVVWLILHV
jgi:protein phosphatase